MALHLQGISSAFLFSRTSPLASFHPSKNSLAITPSTTIATTKCINKSVRCDVTPVDDPAVVVRRSANYQPSSWDYNLVLSFTSDYTDEKDGREFNMLKDDVKRLVNGVEDGPLAKLELVDTVQRLGLKYIFETEIRTALDTVYNDPNDAWLTDDLHTTALRFRILRGHGYNIHQDVFESFKDETGNFKVCLREDVNGLLSLYEAAFYSLEGEDIIEEAKIFATENLREAKDMPPVLARKVDQALDMPLHWRLTRVESRWFIDTYELEQNMNPNLLRLAKLNYNLVQSIHRKEVKDLASWWVDHLGLDKIGFARDRLMEHYFWCSGMVSEPQYGAFREMETKIMCLITTVDDIFDVYGSIEELELITDFVDRWDINDIDKLPINIRRCVLALFNTCNEVGYWTVKERGFNIIPSLSKAWADVCKAYLQEAKWYHDGYKPTLDEYIENALVTVTGPLMLFVSYFMTTSQITEEEIDFLDKLPDIIRSCSIIVRLTNDLATSTYELARGDTLKAVECYMHEAGVSREVSREYITSLAHETWKTMNKDLFQGTIFAEPFLTSIANLARASMAIYQFGDGHGVPNGSTKDHLVSLLVQPIPLD